jgi:hypothetical protein
MLRRIGKVLLVVAFVTAMVRSGATALAGTGCRCYRFAGDRILPAAGGCHFDQKALQCASVSCRGFCS